MASQKEIIKEFLLNGAEGDVFCDLFSFEAPQGMDHLGSLFVAAELRGAPRASWGIPNLIASTMRRTYYEKDDRKPTQAFTAALKEANTVLMHELASGNEGWLGTSSFAACIISNKTIFASRAGSSHVGVWLIRDGKKSNVFVSDTKGVSPFSSMISGRLEDNDIVFAGSTTSLSSVSHAADIKDIYKEVQKKMTERSASCALVIHIPPPDINASTQTIPARILDGNAPLISSVTASYKKFRSFRIRLLLLRDNIFDSFSSFNPFETLRKRVRDRVERFGFISHIRWTAPKKSVFVGALLISAGFLVFQIGNSAISHFSAGNAETATTISTVERDIDSARSALIYGDKNQSEILLLRAQNSLTTISQALSEEVKTTLEANIEDIQNQLFLIHKTPVQEFLVLTGSPLPFAPDRIFWASGETSPVLSFTDGAVGALYRFIINDKKGSLVLRSERGGFMDIVDGGEEYLYVIGKDGITLYDKSAENFASTLPYDTKMGITFGVKAEKTVLIGDINGGQLWKISLEQNNLKFSGPWLKQANKNLISHIKDAAWDGKSAWLLRDDNVILRYTNGTRSEAITISGGQADFHADHLELGPGPLLYVLDDQHARIARINRKGVIEQQYVNETISAASDFTLSADGTTAYILSERTVYTMRLGE